MEKIADLKVFNDTFVEMVKAGQTKEAAVSAQQFTRNKLREESFAEKVLTPIDINNDELDKAEDTELLVKWNDREPDQAPAATIPLGTVPQGYQFKGSRYPSYFTRIVSPIFQKDIDKIRSYDYDIRAILLENSTKDIATELDRRFLTRINQLLGTVDTANALTGYGVPSWKTYPGGLNRANFVQAAADFTKLRVPFGPLQPDGGNSKGIALMNNVTAAEFLKWERSEVGGDLAERQWVEGLPSRQILGINTVYSLKRDLVDDPSLPANSQTQLLPDGTVYFFSSEEFLGKYYRLQPLTVFMENKAFFLSFFQYMNVSLSIGNVRGFYRADFA